MKIKVDSIIGDRYHVQVQVSTGGKWIDFGIMNLQERKEFAEQLRGMATELVKVQS